MKYDDATWHHGGTVREGLAQENAATHIGIFLAWAFERGFAGRLHVANSPSELEAVRQRRMTGRDYLLSRCKGKLTDKELNDVANAFAAAYYEAGYAADWEAFVQARRYGSSYRAPDTWRTFDTMARVLNYRFRQWGDGVREWSPLPSSVLRRRQRWWMPW